MESVTAILEQVASSNEGSLVLVCCLGMLFWQVAGLVAAQQWYLLPLAIGLTALAVFLVNPVADANSLFDLRARFARGSVLGTLALIQALLIGVSFWSGLRAAGIERSDRWRMLLGAVHCCPAIPVVMGALFLQQAWLSQEVGSRPELVGLISGLIVSAAILLGCLIGLGLSRFLRSQVHLLSCVAALTIVCLIPSLNTPPPSGQNGIAMQAAVTSLVPFLVLAALCLGFGCFLQNRKSHPSISTGV